MLRAPAKLTLTLRVTGVRDDGHHLLDAEMVSLDLADTLTVSAGDGVTYDRRPRPVGRDRRRPRSSGALGAPGPAAAGARPQAHPRRRRDSVGLRPTPPRCCGGAASTDLDAAARSRRGCALLPGGAGGPGCGDRRA
ncbi:MAG: hypothetical protein U5R31_02035 [Acidimicrobiia bacterium]|nr:hypothetical protein [Acidimicrobiia bacterium]